MKRAEWLELAMLHLQSARHARTVLRGIISPDYWDESMNHARTCLRHAAADAAPKDRQGKWIGSY